MKVKRSILLEVGAQMVDVKTISSLAGGGFFDDASDDDMGDASAEQKSIKPSAVQQMYADTLAEMEEVDAEEEEFESVDEDIDDILVDTDWNLGNSTKRYNSIAGSGQLNSNAGRQSAEQEQPLEKSKLFQRIKVSGFKQPVDNKESRFQDSNLNPL